MQQTFIDFLKTRRSVTAKKMTRGKVSEEHLKQILEVGIRSRSWGFKTMEIVSDNWSTTEAARWCFTEFMRKNSTRARESIIETRLQRADVVIAVSSRATQSIPL